MYSTLIKYMKAYEKKLESSIREHRREMEKLPEGRLRCFRNRDYYTWYLISRGSNGKSRTLIPKSERQLAEQLALREYCESIARTESKQLHAVKMFLKYFDSSIPGDAYINACPEHSALLKKYVPGKYYSRNQLEWMLKERPQKQPREHELTVTTILGFKVRSKSESDYVSSFAHHHIEFRYEWPLYLSSANKVVFPDFTAKHPITGETIYIEHFGKMDDPEYAEKAAVKVYEYIREGIMPGKNLFLSYESQADKFSSMDAEEMVHKIFCEA